MSFAVTLQQGRPAMSFSAGNDLLTNVILSLEIPQGAFFADPSFGLRRRSREKRTVRTARMIKGDVEKALQWLLDSGRAAAVQVATELSAEDRNRIRATALVTGVDGNQVSYDKFVEMV